MAVFRTRLPLSAAIVACLAISGLSLVIAPTAHADKTVTPTSTSVGVDSAAQRTLAAEKLIAQAEADPAHYAGVKVTPDGIEMRLTSDSTLARISSVAGTPVRIRTATNSTKTLEALTSRISRDGLTGGLGKISISGWGPDYESNTVRINLVHYDPSIAADLVSRYGGPSVVSVDPGEHPLATRAFTRAVDGPPWYGGDVAVDQTVGSACSLGFNYVSAAMIHYATTAAHCSGGTGSGSLSQRINNGDASRFIGVINNRNFINGGEFDIEFMASSVNGHVWGGGVTSGLLDRRVTSVATADPVGGVICTDGATSGEICGVTIVNPSFCQTFNDHVQTCGLVVTHHAGIDCVAGGDSGGPVETTIGSTQTEARGEIIGYGDSATSCYYTPIRFITRTFKLSVILG